MYLKRDTHYIPVVALFVASIDGRVGLVRM